MAGKVLILMGSKSDAEEMEEAARGLSGFGIPHTLTGASALFGFASLLATAQMPAGVPVATMAIGKAGARNAGHLAAQILALSSPDLREKIRAHRRRMAEEVAASAEEIR